jgi:hypothetical protein
VALGGLVITLLLGFALPGLWGLYLIVLLIIIFVPSSNKHDEYALVQNEVVNQIQPNVQTTIASIEKQIAEATNDDVKSGLTTALAIVKQNLWSQQSAPAVAQYAVPTVTQPLDNVAFAEISEAEKAAEKEKQDQQNTNTILYVASFLLVGAAVLFIGTALDPAAKFMGLVLITAAFYGAGIYLFKTFEKLHPAATAFVGTGVALVPFVGLALYYYVLPDGHMSWFLTSLVGLVMYVYATLLIRKQVLAYLSAAFIFSLTTSAISVLSVPFVWYFVTIILTGSLLGYFAYKKPHWLPSELHTPLEQSGTLAAPVAIAGSLFVSDRLSLLDYEIIVGVSTIHYLVMSLGLGTKEKLQYWSIGRIGLLSLFMLAAYDITNELRWVGVVLAVSAFLSYVYSARHSEQTYENAWMLYPQLALVAATGLWLYDWTNVSTGLLLLAVMSLIQLVKTKQSLYGVGLVLGLILLPITVIDGIFQYRNSAEAIASLAIFASLCILLIRYGLQDKAKAYCDVSTVLYALFAIQAILAVVMIGTPGWIASVVLVASVVFFAAAFVERAPLLHVLSNVLFVYGIWNALTFYGYNDEWQLLITAWISAGAWYLLRFYYSVEEFERRNILFASTLAVLVIAAIGSAYEPVTATAAALTGIVIAGMLAYEGYTARGNAYYELSLFVLTLSLQRIIAIEYPDTNWLVYTHWWAGTVGIMALLRRQAGERQDAYSRGIIALLLLSVPTGFMALVEPDTYQLLFLIEHVILLVAGFVTNRKLLLKWGAVGIGLALVKLLMGYTFILLFLLAIGLIALAFWRLLRKTN